MAHMEQLVQYVCLDSDSGTEWSLTEVFGKLVHFDPVGVKFKGQGRLS